ncbi:MAG: alpha/beta hydrolase [Cyanobacteria bacterium J06627_8]
MVQENRFETRLIQLGDDRQIAYCEYGDPNGTPVFYFHGTPGSRYEPMLGDQAGRDYNYRILALDRPGMGRSDYMNGRALLDWPQDVQEIARNLEIDRFGVIGVSGGGPYALACGYALPERVEFTVLMGSWGPVSEEPELWKQMAPLDQFLGKLSRYVPWAFYIPFSLLGYAAKWLSPYGFIRSLESSMSRADKELTSDEGMARFFASDVKESFRQGARGPADDAMILYGEWGFGIEDISVKVDLFHGEEDKFAPYTYAIYLNEKLPNSELHGYPGEGHLFVMRLFEQVFERVSCV